MSITASDIQDMVSGEFTNISEGVCTSYITMAESRLDESVWGVRYDMGVLYLSCHLLAVDKSGSSGASGPTTSLRSGPVAQSFATALGVSGGASQYQSTSYGRTLMSLMAELPKTKGFVV